MYSCIGVMESSTPKTFECEHGSCFIPFTVSYKDGKWYVGWHDMTESASEFEVIHNTKRVRGCDANEGCLANDIKDCRLSFEFDDKSQPIFRLQSGEIIYTIEIEAFILF